MRILLCYALERADAGDFERLVGLLSGLLTHAPDLVLTPFFLAPLSASMAHSR